MFRFLLVRIASAIPVLIILSIVTFAIIQAPPGDYADYIRSQLINQSGASFAQAEEQAQAYRVAHGLDQPMVIQYFAWIKGIITQGDFGYSMYYNKPVADVVGERLPRTLLLALVCHIFASVLGIGSPVHWQLDGLILGFRGQPPPVPRKWGQTLTLFIRVFYRPRTSSRASKISPRISRTGRRLFATGTRWSWKTAAT
jgi:peptide/nickel transport system permease protein